MSEEAVCNESRFSRSRVFIDGSGISINMTPNRGLEPGRERSIGWDVFDKSIFTFNFGLIVCIDVLNVNIRLTKVPSEKEKEKAITPTSTWKKELKYATIGHYLELSKDTLDIIGKYNTIQWKNATFVG